MLTHSRRRLSTTNTRSDNAEGVWVWKYDGNDLFMDREEPIRFRVEQETFVDVGPVKEPKLLPGGMRPQTPGAAGGTGVDEQTRESPYTIIGSIADNGLGLLSWWEAPQEDE
ncbi:DNA-directed RNA polymerase III complex subunit Rpc25 [Polyrhizophydium stewartii]|uniref:DNA-directed RNA polymerase III complex subunit Rpc25 n=1 Tax=Polyrhizophydium stewartii TaxID=2732419 RepID=A0ABR4NH55_9FUNG